MNKFLCLLSFLLAGISPAMACEGTCKNIEKTIEDLVSPDCATNAECTKCVQDQIQDSPIVPMCASINAMKNAKDQQIIGGSLYAAGAATCAASCLSAGVGEAPCEVASYGLAAWDFVAKKAFSSGLNDVDKKYLNFFSKVDQSNVLEGGNLAIAGVNGIKRAKSMFSDAPEPAAPATTPNAPSTPSSSTAPTNPASNDASFLENKSGPRADAPVPEKPAAEPSSSSKPKKGGKLKLSCVSTVLYAATTTFKLFSLADILSAETKECHSVDDYYNSQTAATATPTSGFNAIISACKKKLSNGPGGVLNANVLNAKGINYAPTDDDPVQRALNNSRIPKNSPYSPSKIAKIIAAKNPQNAGDLFNAMNLPGGMSGQLASLDAMLRKDQPSKLFGMDFSAAYKAAGSAGLNAKKGKKDSDGGLGDFKLPGMDAPKQKATEMSFGEKAPAVDAASDELHSGYTGTLFNIISQRMLKTADRLEKTSPASPMNRRLAGLKD